jgi:hypothetical protein
MGRGLAMSDNDLRNQIAAIAAEHQIDDSGVNWWECICGRKWQYRYVTDWKTEGEWR